MKREMRERVGVPVWALVVTYLLCWAFAIAIIVLELSGYLQWRPVLIVLAVYLILWPVFQSSPGEIIRRVFPG